MRALILSLFLVFLLIVGMFVNPSAPTTEHFVSYPDNTRMSPALANMLSTPNMIEKTKPNTKPKVNTLARGATVQNATKKQVPYKVPQGMAHNAAKKKMKDKCPKCPVCPDMSQYVKLDEVPCWNCSLP
jgi:hypothetical protein